MLVLPFIGNAQEVEKKINWMTVEEAQEAIKTEPRKVIMDVYTKWCGPCKMMMKNTFTNENLIDFVNANYYAVKFDAESKEDVTFKDNTYSNPDYVEGKKGRNGVHEFSRYLNITAYPSLVYFDEDLNLLTVDVGYKTADQVEVMMKFFNDDLHKVAEPQKAWEAFVAKFKPTFGK